MKPGISLCMIVKDEEQNLPRSLASVQGCADQYVVVDTGSTDRSKAIADEYHCELHDFVWCDDFAAAKNNSIGYADHEWIFHLDADEQFRFTAEELRQAIAEAEADGIETLYVKLVDIDHDGNRCAFYYQPRIWRNGRGVKYINAIHTAPLTRLPERKTELELYHYGYKAISAETFQKKRERNFRIFQQEFTKNPHDTRLGWELAREYCVIEKFAEALTVIDHTIAEFRRQFPQQPVAVIMYDLRIRALMGLKRSDEALSMVEEAIKVWPEQPRFPLLRLKMLAEADRYEDICREFSNYAELIKRYRRGEILQDELTLFGIAEYPEALKTAALAAIFAGKTDEGCDRLLELYGENSELAVNTLATVTGRLPLPRLLTLLKAMIERQKNPALMELAAAVAAQLSPDQIDFIRFLTAALREN